MGVHAGQNIKALQDSAVEDTEKNKQCRYVANQQPSQSSIEHFLFNTFEYISLFYFD